MNVIDRYMLYKAREYRTLVLCKLIHYRVTQLNVAQIPKEWLYIPKEVRCPNDKKGKEKEGTR